MAILGDTTTTKLTTDVLVAKEIKVSNQSDVNITLLNAIYPIGSIYVFCIPGQAIPDTCPIANTLGGTWVKIENRFLYSTTDASKYGQLSGSNRAWIVDHYHEATLRTDGNVTESAGNHGHPLVINATQDMDIHKFRPDDGDKRITLNTSGYKQNPNYIYTGSTDSLQDSSDTLLEYCGDHIHIIPSVKAKGNTGAPIASNGTRPSTINTETLADTANMPAYLGVIAWRRTA